MSPLRVIVDTALSYGTAAGVLCMFFSFFAAIGSRDRYGDEMCCALIAIGFVVAVVCGFPLLLIRSL